MMSPQRQPVTLASGLAGDDTIDDLELFYARRALRTLKTKLGRQGLLDLLADDIEAGNAFLREAALASGGEFVHGTVVLATEGLTAAAFAAWLGSAFGDLGLLVEAHPEHWAFSEHGVVPVNVVETIGTHPASFYMAGWGSAPPAWLATADTLLPESEYPLRMAADLELADGTVFGRVLCQFGDTATGFSTALTVYVPRTCGEVVDQHLRHFAVEFRHWITAAVAAAAG